MYFHDTIYVTFEQLYINKLKNASENYNIKQLDRLLI